MEPKDRGERISYSEAFSSGSNDYFNYVAFMNQYLTGPCSPRFDLHVWFYTNELNHDFSLCNSGQTHLVGIRLNDVSVLSTLVTLLDV